MNANRRQCNLAKYSVSLEQPTNSVRILLYGMVFFSKCSKASKYNACLGSVSLNISLRSSKSFKSAIVSWADTNDSWKNDNF